MLPADHQARSPSTAASKPSPPLLTASLSESTWLSEPEMCAYRSAKAGVSGGTRSEDGRRCRDTFLSLKKTCQKNAISFWAYLGDRLGITAHGIAPLPDLIRQRAAPKPV